MLSVFILLIIVSSCDGGRKQIPSLEKPTLTLDPPWDVILPGEEHSLTCHFPHTGCNVEFIRINGRGRIGHISEVNYTGSVKVVEYNTLNGRIDYTCKYEKYFGNKGWARSPFSDPVGLTVKDTLPKAGIALNPAAGVVSRGQPFEITCTGDIRPSGAQILLYRDGDVKPAETVNASGSERSTSVTITDTDTAGTWNYTCVYKQTVKRNTYFSPHSDQVRVTVTDVPWNKDPSGRKAWLIGGCLAMIVVLLLLAVVFFMIRKKRGARPSSDRKDPGPAEPEMVYASLNTAALNRGAVTTSAEAPLPPADQETCVYAVMKVK